MYRSLIIAPSLGACAATASAAQPKNATAAPAIPGDR
jgi:hypothetical protein